jgi:flagellar basal body-associated protein FliL
MIALKILLIILIVFVVLFVLSLLIYFFNLDMKAAALIMPVLEKYYDWQEKKREK